MKGKDEKTIEMMEKVRGMKPDLSINRLPSLTKEAFLALSNENYSGDYGMCFKWCFDQAMEYQIMKESFFKGAFSQPASFVKSEPEEKTDKIKMASGRVIEKNPSVGGGVNE